MIDWSTYAVGGATRPDAISGLDQGFQEALARMFLEAPENVRGALRLVSAYRSPERQAELWDQALAKYGSPERARKWVAPPGRSKHNSGHAADLKYLDPAARAWVHENAARYGLAFPLSHEPWHIELASARGGGGAGGSTSNSPPTGNALAALGRDAPAQAPQNALAPSQAPFQWSGGLDPTAFVSRPYAPVEPMQPMQPTNYLTRYL
jgi:hypothetical protein